MQISSYESLPKKAVPVSLAAGENTGFTSSTESGGEFTTTPQIRRLLIVDDSGTERAHLRKLLEAKSFEVSEASSGSEALRLAKESLPNAILMDIIMDDGDGYQACRSLKRDAKTAHIPVIMVSSKANSVDRKWAEKLGASNYIVKPYTDEQILAALNEL